MCGAVEKKGHAMQSTASKVTGEIHLRLQMILCNAGKC
jgi:hypothetical protein